MWRTSTTVHPKACSQSSHMPHLRGRFDPIHFPSDIHPGAGCWSYRIAKHLPPCVRATHHRHSLRLHKESRRHGASSSGRARIPPRARAGRRSDGPGRRPSLRRGRHPSAIGCVTHASAKERSRTRSSRTPTTTRSAAAAAAAPRAGPRSVRPRAARLRVTHWHHRPPPLLSRGRLTLLSRGRLSCSAEAAAASLLLCVLLGFRHSGSLS